MITEPELTDGSDDDRPVDVIGDDDRPRERRGGRLSGLNRRRGPWIWALCGAVVASAVWAGVLRGTDYGRTAAPDLHGYRLVDPCTVAALQPLVDMIALTSMSEIPGPMSVGSTLDHISCSLVGNTEEHHGWITSYTISVGVDLHKKTDPRTEFEDGLKARDADPPDPAAGSSVVMTHDPRTSRPLTGLGDRAFLTGDSTSQTVDVLHGGAVFSVGVSATEEWIDMSERPTDAGGSPERPPRVDTKRFGAELPQTVRHLMSVLSAR
ncbi:hypothetical protein [Streptomyces sp. CBMA29]|uniref:hypothetical protein n=1 Tax=Streptomyces sp. CBMA29 TaxID=1896314 RepID=UPI0016618DF8|nr:hypothetical protein [Streptomyces sp. CBMA29]MBD0737777.1 hypothetical protein [Streptomyces sp. CBMA29]